MKTTKRSRPRVLKSWSKHNLPEELWPEILSRLPAKSILRFRSVSKSWKSIINDPDFARLHLNRFNNGPESSRLLFVTGDSDECVVKNSETLTTIRSLGFLESDLDSVNSLRSSPAGYGDYQSIRLWSILSSIDGLFLLKSEQESDLMLWNPSIKKTLALPPLETPQDSIRVQFGLGYDPSIRDYKCVCFVDMAGGSLQIAAIYTLGTNSWIAFQGDVLRDIVLHGGERIVPFDGALYAPAQDSYPTVGPVKLVSFDLRREVFASIELPDLDEYPFVYDQALTMVYDDGGCGYSLGVVNLTRPEGSVWILQRFGDDSKLWSWVRCYTFVLAPQFGRDVWFIKFLCMTKNREMLWACRDTVICYNLETRQEKRLLENNRKTLHRGDVFPYAESLILLHH